MGVSTANSHIVGLRLPNSCFFDAEVNRVNLAARSALVNMRISLKIHLMPIVSGPILG